MEEAGQRELKRLTKCSQKERPRVKAGASNKEGPSESEAWGALEQSPRKERTMSPGVNRLPAESLGQPQISSEASFILCPSCHIPRPDNGLTECWGNSTFW